MSTQTAKKHYFSHLVGKTIVAVQSMSKEEIDESYWYCDENETTILFFSDGTGVIVQQDPEGNGPGWLEEITWEKK